MGEGEGEGEGEVETGEQASDTKCANQDKIRPDQTRPGKIRQDRPNEYKERTEDKERHHKTTKTRLR